MENHDVVDNTGEMEMQASMDGAESMGFADEGGYIESKPGVEADSEYQDDSHVPMGLDAPDSETRKLLDALENPEAVQAKEEKPFSLGPKTPEQEEAELMEGVKSERGRERIKSIINARKEAEAKLSTYESFKKMAWEAGLDSDGLSKTMQYSQLLGSGDEHDLKVALEMVEQQREMICKKLGIAAPGIDPLSDFPDLQEAVQKGQITREHAARLAKYERVERANQQNRQAIQMEQQGLRQHHNVVMQGAQSSQAYLMTRKGEADFQAKMQHIHSYFADPKRVQEFVSTYEPRQWFSQLKFMYENMMVPQQRSNQNAQPIRSRPVMSGSAASNQNISNAERLMAHLDNMGI